MKNILRLCLFVLLKCGSLYASQIPNFVECVTTQSSNMTSEQAESIRKEIVKDEAIIKSGLTKFTQQLEQQELMLRGVLKKPSCSQQEVEEVRQKYYSAITTWCHVHVMCNTQDLCERGIVDHEGHSLDFLSRALIKTADARMNFALTAKLRLSAAEARKKRLYVDELGETIHKYNARLRPYTAHTVDMWFSFEDRTITLGKSLRALARYKPWVHDYNDKIAIQALLSEDPELIIVDTLCDHILKEYKQKSIFVRSYEKIRYWILFELYIHCGYSKVLDYEDPQNYEKMLN